MRPSRSGEARKAGWPGKCRLSQDVPLSPRRNFDLLNPRHLIAFCHLAFGLICLHRPNLDQFTRAYAPFGDLERWGWALVALAVLLLLSPRGSVVLMAAQLVSSTTLFAIVALLTAGFGPLPTAGFGAVLGVASLLLFVRTFAYWLHTQRWFCKLLERPPGWARRIKERNEKVKNDG